MAIDQEVRTVDPTPLFSRRAQCWEPGAIRSLLPLEAIPGMLSLVAGKPNPNTFPFAKISIHLKGEEDTPLVLDESLLTAALQYGMPSGHPQLVEWFIGLQNQVHGLDNTRGWSCCIGNGSQELLHKAFQVFTDPGDSVMVETPAYPGVAGFLRADGHELVEAPIEADGLDFMALEKILSSWPPYRRRPSVLYTVPTGSNPTGRTCSEWRKVEILRLAKRFNFLIFEDDAYYYLNFSPAKTRPRSYLALEREVNGETGRVVRFDSLSKIVSSGMRLGVLTGPLPVVRKIVQITENINLQPSSTTQLLAYTLLNHWGHSGFLKHCSGVRDFYRQRRDAFASAAERHLKGRAAWDTPSAGMFFWLSLRLPPGEDSFSLLSKKSIEYGILAIPGTACMPNLQKACQIRISYSLVAEADMDEACRRIAKLVDSAWVDKLLNWYSCRPNIMVIPARQEITI